MDEAERKRKYAQEKLTTFELRFSPGKDDDILSRLDMVDSKQGYIRMLIRNDLIRRGIIPGTPDAMQMIFHKGRDKITSYNPRSNLKLVTNGPDQPIIDYLQSCRSKIDYIRDLIRQDIDRGGGIAGRVTTPKVSLDVETVRTSAERTAKLLRDLTEQEGEQEAKQTEPIIKALNQWILNHR